jgi:secreted Zn-dependent insulinase-like peptidase
LQDGSDEGSDGSGSDDDDDDDDGGSASGSDAGGGGARRRRAKGAAPEAAVKKAAAAMSVGVGHFSDPWHLQGLSHYLEHMLFMGSAKYPDENDYDAFLSAHGGASNACTEEEATTFHFDVRPDALRPALDRFAQFFVAPLLKADALEREVKAVDNEFAGVAQSDSCRLMQLRAHTARAGHVASKFGWGNRKSLVEGPAAAGLDVRAELLEHYRAQYSAERMKLVILGGEPLATLAAWAAELFGGVAGGRGPRPSYAAEGAAFEGGRLYLLPAVRQEHRLSVLFQLPCLAAEYLKKAEEYVSHLVGHEGAGSLLAALKARGWASELCAGVSDQTSAGWLFDVSVTLTEAGLAAAPGGGLAAAGLVFEYLGMLRAAGAQRWAWDEMALIAGMKFRFQEEEDAAEYAAQVASDLHHYPAEHALAGPFLHREYDPQLVSRRDPERMSPRPQHTQKKAGQICARGPAASAPVRAAPPAWKLLLLSACFSVALLLLRLQISRLLDGMTPAAARLDLQTHAYDAAVATVAEVVAPARLTPGEEPWFGLPYAHAPLPEALLRRWEQAPPSPDIALPPRNDYLPSDFSLRCDDADAADAAGAAAGAANGGATAAADGAAAPAPDDDGAAFPSPPEIILEEPGLRLWHKLDRTFRLPRAAAYFRLASPAAYAAPRAAAATHLLCKLLEDALCQEAYLADVAGLHYGLWFEGQQGEEAGGGGA